MSNFWNLNTASLYELLDSGEEGLSQPEADLRLKKTGFNELPVKKGRSLLSRFLDQFKDFLVILLLVSAVVAFFLGEYIDSIAIMVIVVVNALIGFVQEYKAEQALLALKAKEQEFAKVYRSGKLTQVEARLLVPGDVLLVEAGDRVAADCRVLTSYNLKLDEAMLTGESLPVQKNTALLPEKTSLGDQLNMLFKGTAVMEGKGRAIVVATGGQTEIGRIAELLQTDNKEETPLQKEINEIGKKITYLILGIALLVFLMLLWRRSAVIEALLTAIAISVAAIPEGLPAIVAVVLSVGVVVLSRQKTIVRTLKAVETLGAVKYLLTDKTGTLTWNKINVVRLMNSKHEEFILEGEGYSPKGQVLTLKKKTPSAAEMASIHELLRVGVVCNGAEVEYQGSEVKIVGDTTEGALLIASERLKQGYEKVRDQYEVLDEEPFSSDTKRMLVLVKEKKTGKYFVFGKGAPEVILKLANLKKTEALFFQNQVNTWAAAGWRNLALVKAELTLEESKNYLKHLHKLELVGLVAEEDTVRKEAIEAVKKARVAGIETIMITGDHRLAALSIAKQTTIAQFDDQVINGDDLALMEDNLLLDRLLAKSHPVRVFSRVSPEQKLRIVDLLKARTGAIVAVTGDGVNDAPSIKSANVGVAMGKGGSDVAKEVADIVLGDDNYATLVTGIFQGRVIFDNLIKFIRYLLSCNIGEVVVVFVGTFLGYLHILLPIQILFVNLVTDSLPALALGFEKGTPDILKRQPRNPKERILNLKRWAGIGIEGLFIGVLVLLAFKLFLPYGFSYARTIAFLVLVVTQLFQALNSRDEHQTLLKVGLFGNPFLWLSLILSFALTYLVTQTGYLSHIFQTEIIVNPWHWAALLGISSLVLGMSGLRKVLSWW